jgi:hypothetical protein
MPASPQSKPTPAVSNDNMSQQDAKALAQRHVDLAHRIVAWFGFDRRREITWGPEYNQAARDLYVEACDLVGVTPHPAD